MPQLTVELDFTFAWPPGDRLVYATCLFCNSALGRNESLEHFPVGRRLAWDMAKGRLWVVCRRCERWNLTPLEARWEAMEEAERAFRATRQRVATDNIALARLREGLELVRVGAPPRLELATWRYGDQFGRRRAKYVAFTSFGMLLALAYPFGSFIGGVTATTITGVVTAHNILNLRHIRRWPRVPVTIAHDETGQPAALTRADLGTSRLHREAGADDWYLTVDQAEQPLPRYGYGFAQLKRLTLRGDHAHRVLASALPHANRTGGRAHRVREALDVMAAAPNLNRLMTTAADAGTRPGYYRSLAVGGLAAPLRLALEMALHEDDERRAMEGELAALEERWREAEQIAEIADSLLVSAVTTARLEALRQSRDASTTNDTPAEGGTR